MTRPQGARRGSRKRPVSGLFSDARTTGELGRCKERSDKRPRASRRLIEISTSTEHRQLASRSRLRSSFSSAAAPCVCCDQAEPCTNYTKAQSHGAFDGSPGYHARSRTPEARISPSPRRALPRALSFSPPSWPASCLGGNLKPHGKLPHMATRSPLAGQQGSCPTQ